jgi:bacterioferritin (cytochrome b1)
MTFDFEGARLDPERDRATLGWIFNQFLYGEVTGIQVGHWLYDAPDLEAARFLAKQSVEEMQHVGNFVRILGMLELEPAPAHPVLRFLATGMMGESWPEHVALEMATGEGFVLTAMYALIDTLDHPEVVAILARASRQEESHVEFGERQTMLLVAQRPALCRRLAGLALVWMWGVRRLATNLGSRVPVDHAVLRQLPAFLAHALACTETRLMRMGLVERRPSEMRPAARAALVAEALAWKGGVAAADAVTLPLRLVPGLGRKKRLTDTYLADPGLRAPHGASSRRGEDV